MKSAMLGNRLGIRRRSVHKDDEQQNYGEPSASVGASTTSCAMDRATARDHDRRSGLMLVRQVGSLNVWKAPVAAGPALRYAKRCSRSPSPIPRRKVSFRLSASSGSLIPSIAETENLRESFSSSFFDGAPGVTRMGRGRARQASSHIDSPPDPSASFTSSVNSSVKSSLKVPRQSVSIRRTYDPTTILLEEDEKRVNFSSVSVHLHSMTLGDNPAVSAGVPVQIDWKPTTSFTRSLDDYESARDHPPRSVPQLRIGPLRRENILKASGEERDDVQCVLRSVERIRASRAKNAGAVSVDAASSPSRTRATGYADTNQRIRSGTALPKVLQRLIVSKPNAQKA